MGVYDSDYVCVPYPQSKIWIPVVVLQFIVVFLACISHVIFVKLVVASQKFSSYLKHAFFWISFQMLLMLLTSSGAFLITLAHGKYIEDCQISDITFRKYLLYAHSFGEYFFVVCELLGTFERVASMFANKFRKTKMFRTLFIFGMILGAFLSLLYIYLIRISFKTHLFAIGFGSLTLMEVLNGIIVSGLVFVSMDKYKKQNEEPLHVRYEFSQSYAYSKCAVASVLARITIILYVYLKIVFGTGDSPFYYIMNLLINLYCLVYPWTIMLSHRKIRRQILRYFKNHPGLVQDQNQSRTLYTIDGRQMNNHTSEEYYATLDNAWKGPEK
ncbi:unnamed protein product [Caenorhabditis brenneri]